MNKNITRIGLAAIAAFYVVVGGLWASDYFPLQKYYAQTEIKNDLAEKLGSSRAYLSREYQEASAVELKYILAHPELFLTEARLDFYKALLRWATVGLAVGGGVLFLTRGNRGAQVVKGNAQ